MPFPDALKGKPKVIFFTDFDGTITLQDTNDHITANYGCGHDRLREITELIGSGKVSFRDGFQMELDTWNLPFAEVLDILKRDIKLDPGFKEFAIWAKKNNVPVVVLSSGMIPIIEAMLKHLVGEELMAYIEVIANETQLRAPGNSLDKAGGWTVKYHDDSSFGHDKSLAIRPYANEIAKMQNEDEKPTLLYAGDGVSDLSAARETDLLFAKTGKDLVNYCEREGIPFTLFDDWSDIFTKTKEIYEGSISVRKVAEEGLRKHRTNSLDKDASRPSQIKQ